MFNFFREKATESLWKLYESDIYVIEISFMLFICCAHAVEKFLLRI